MTLKSGSPFLFVLAFSVAVGLSRDSEALDLLPLPTGMIQQNGRPVALPNTIAVRPPADTGWHNHLEIVATHLSRITAGKHQLTLDSDASPFLMVKRDAKLAAEAYRIEISQEGATLSASSLRGLAHATASFMQIVGNSTDRQLDEIAFEDSPKLSYRSFMIDMGRNPHSVGLLKETIDLCWFYKIDSLHLHLTDDQRIAFPSTAFPKLWDGKITLDQFHDLESYAVARGVTLIPELEVPGHSGLLRKHYPEVFGKTATEVAETEAAFDGISTLLDEMLDVFSSPYIHIGGDEAFGVPEDSQRALINRLHSMLKSKGRKTLVWEGPAPGKGNNKVHPEVIHINWRTINYPADQMLEDGHQVVNAAWDPLYVVDHYPRINFTMTSPQHVYETLKLTRFKHVNPGIRTFADPIMTPSSDQLIGFCMPWWEGREENFLTQSAPRMIPFSEVSWNPDVQRDFADLTRRTDRMESIRLRAFYPTTISTSPLVIPADGVFHDQTKVTLEKIALSDSVIHYTTDGSEPNARSPIYNKPFTLEKSAVVRSAIFKDGLKRGHDTRLNLTKVTPDTNLALGKPVTSSTTSGPPFSVERVTDGGTGPLDFYLGYPASPEPIAVTIDLQSETKIGRIVVHAYTISNSFESYCVKVSQDGITYDEIASRLNRPKTASNRVEHRFDTMTVRFIRIESVGNKGYVFDSFSKLIEVQAFAQ